MGVQKPIWMMITFLTLPCYVLLFLLSVALSDSFLHNLSPLKTRFHRTRMAALVENSNPHNFSWQQTMLRIKDPSVSVPFYEKNFGFTLIHKYDFPQWKFALYFLEILPKDQPYTLTPGTPEAENYLWTMPGTCLELTHNYGSESDETFKVNNGNVEPFRGFGHIAVMTPDVYKASAELEAAGVRFQKRVSGQPSFTHGKWFLSLGLNHPPQSVLTA